MHAGAQLLLNLKLDPSSLCARAHLRMRACVRALGEGELGAGITLGYRRQLYCKSSTLLPPFPGIQVNLNLIE